MVGFSDYFKKPVFLSALFCIFIFYSGLFNFPQRYKYNSLIPQDIVTSLSGKLLNSPVKNSNGKYYSASLELKNTISNTSYISSANGRITVLIPSNLVEAFYPGALYSSSKKTGGTLFESGGNYTFSGKFSSSKFIVQECKDNYWESTIFGKIDYFRALCRLQFKRLMYSWGEAGGLLLALLCGAKEYTNSAVSENFRNSGLSHILALSGMHLSMFSSIALFFGNKIGRKKLSFIIRLIVLLIFVWFAGLSPSLFRAYICAMLILISKISGTENPDMIMVLCFSFLLQSVLHPQDINNIGFILSYTALAGILIFNKFFNNQFSKFLPKFAANSLGASCSAQIFTIPISLKLFGSFSPIGIIATMFVAPLITIFIYLGLLLIFVSLLIPLFSGYSEIILKFLYNIIVFIVAFFSKAPKWSLI